MAEPTTTPYLRAGFLAAVLAGAASVLVTAVLVLVSGRADAAFGPNLLLAARTWLVACGSGVEVGGTAIGIVPVGAWLVAIVVVAVVTRWTLPDPVDELPAFVVSVAGFLGLVAGVLASVVSSGSTSISPVRAAVAAFVVGGLGAALGAVSKHGGAGALWFSVSEDVRRAVRASVFGVAAVLATAAVIVLALLLLHRDRAGDLWALLDPGVGGGFALALINVLVMPTGVLWTASVLIGPGFALGTETSVDMTGSHLGAVPGLPFLAALPSPGEFPGWAFVLGLVPLLAGAWSGWRSDAGGREGLLPRLVAGAAAGGVAGFVLGVLVGASGGSIGPGRMAETGPPALTPLLVAVPVMAMGGAIGAALAHYREGRAHPSRRADLGERDQPAGPDRRDDES